MKTIMQCIWCGCETTTKKEEATELRRYANKEHIFPEGVGGEKCLTQGKVCATCNEGFSEVDNDLRHQNALMAKQFQDASYLQGKPDGKIRGKKDRARKEAMVKNITAYDDARISRGDNFHQITFVNTPGGFGAEPFDERFCRALHKCAVNLLYDNLTYSEMLPAFRKVIDFVYTGKGDYRQWSYGACYANMFQLATFEPFGLVVALGEQRCAAVLFFPAMVAVVGLLPGIVQPQLLQLIGDNLSLDTLPEKEREYLITRFNGGIFEDDRRKRFGSTFKFAFLKKHIASQPHPGGNFLLLFTCDVCGQTNSSQLTLEKRTVLEPFSSHIKYSRSKGWNKITIDDLKWRGFQVEKWESDDLERYLNQPFSYPANNQFLEGSTIENCKSPCINCGSMVTWSKNDLYL